MDLPPDALSGFGSQARALATLFRAGRGALIGETTCASRSLHTLDPRRPSAIRVLAHADAGEVFYGRPGRGEICHLDVFHELGRVEHRAMSAALRAACAAYVSRPGGPRALAWVPESLALADLVDLQTATGGGRISGALRYGTGAGLRRAHLNHCHIACRVPDQGLAWLFWLVHAVESEILRQGLEIRLLESLEHEFVPGGPELDLSPYATFSDSLLKGPLLDGRRRDGRPADGATAEPPELDAGLARLAIELAGEFGTLEDLARVMERIVRGSGGHSSSGYSASVWAQALPVLASKGLTSEGAGWPALTARGWQLHRALHAERRELEAQFKRMLRRVPRGPAHAGKGSARPGGSLGRGSLARPESRPWVPGERLAALATVPTLIAALARGLEGRSGEGCTGESGGRRGAAGPGTAGRGATGLGLKASDLRVPKARPREAFDVCLVLDASASMAGRRLRAAKFLTQHLLLSFRDRVGVIVFQERQARLVVPFTRDLRAVERGLASIEPLGLTPLADGLLAAADYVRHAHRAGACLLLITDGIPTVPRWGPHPMDDARAAAAEIGRRRLRLVCLGLAPNRGFLTELAATARGALYVVDELEADALVDLVHRDPTFARRARGG